jgi:virginiamycin B lyase
LRLSTHPITLFVVAVAVLIGALGAPRASGTTAARCAGRTSIHGHKAKVFRAAGKTVVYRVPTSRDDGAGNPIDDYYACLDPRGALRFVASSAPDTVDFEYGSNLVLEGLRTFNSYVIAKEQAGGASIAQCYKYEQSPCPSPDDWARIVNLRTGQACDTASAPFATLTAELAGGSLVCPPGTTPAGSAFTRYTKGLTAPANSGAPAPTSIAVGPDGDLWFTDPGTAAIGRLDPATGAITEYRTGLASEALPGEIVAGPDGNLWFTDDAIYGSATAAHGAIGQIDPSTGAITEYSAGMTPNTEPGGIAAGPDGALWFTLAPDPAASQAAIGRIEPGSGAITVYTAGLRPTSFPSAIAAGPDGALWFADAGQIGRIEPGSDTITEYAGLPADSTVVAIVAGPDGGVWFTLALLDGMAIGRIAPATGAITIYTTGLSPGLEPGAITAGPDGALWFAGDEAGGSAVIGRIDPASGAITEYGIPAAAPFGLVSGPDGDLWAADPGATDYTAFGYRLRSAPAAIERLSLAALTPSP